MSEHDLNPIVLELRAAKPAPSADTRERVRALGEPAPRRLALQRPSVLRAALVVVPTALAAAIAVAVVHGVLNAGAPHRVAVAPQRHGEIVGHRAAARLKTARRALQTVPLERTPIAPAAGRLQKYEASMRIRVGSVDELSRATQRSIRLTRNLGGFVGSVGYGSHSGDRGGATLVLRVPIDRIQDAIAQLSQLGTILQQRVKVIDVQQRAGQQARVIARLRATITRLEHNGTDAAQLARDRTLLAVLERRQARFVREASFARIALVLTTKQKSAAPAHAGRLHRTLGDAGSVLAREGEIALFALIVLAPFALLGAAAVAAARWRGHRETDRLLEQT
jgi:hypothetical protein